MSEKQLKILVVEKQAMVASELKKVISDYGISASIVGSIDKALVRAKAFQFDLFFVNAGSDGRDAMDFVNKLKSTEKYNEVPAMFMFTPGSGIDTRLIDNMDLTDFIKLPLDLVEFEIRFKTLLIKAKLDINLIQKTTEYEEDKPKGKVLLVEDNPLNQKVLGMFISKAGFEYDVASNGQMAVDFCLKNTYTYILMDIYMPGMDGTEATVEIRKQEEGKEGRTKIIAISANESEESVKRCYDSGMNDYLVKPFTLEALRAKLV